MNRSINSLWLPVVLLCSGCSMFGMQNVNEPAYSLELQDGQIEIRSYPELLLAETTVSGNYDDNGKEGFRRLSGYIFGKNNKQQEISMTAPVLQQEAEEKWRMAFVMPVGLSESNAPTPDDDQVNVKIIPGKRVAVLKYSGTVNAEIISNKGKILETWVNNNGYKAISPVRSARYDPPWTIPMLRRNEVQVDIE